MEKKTKSKQNGFQKVNFTSVPFMDNPPQNDQVTAVLDWPSVEPQPIDEFNTPGYIAQAFPVLFPKGEGDLTTNRKHSITPVEYFHHLLLYKDKRFANDPRFRFFALNSTMRWCALRSGRLFVHRHEQLRGQTVKELKATVTKQPSLLKQIMCYGTKLRGTRPYWRARLSELLDMERQLGLPTVFMTLSAADLHWPHLTYLLLHDRQSSEDVVDEEAVLDEIDYLTDRERMDMLAEMPLTPSLFFFERAEFFLNVIVKKKLGVVDYWRRYEWQHRGSPHVHMLLWLPNAPDVTQIKVMSPTEKENVVKYYDNLVCTVNPGLNTPPAKVHPCRKLLSHVEDRHQDMCQLVNKVQRHTKCSESYCLRKKKSTGQLECRYHFPFTLSDRSHLVVDEEGKVELVTKRNDSLVNKYHPSIMQLWRANMDITPVLSKDAFLNYIAKYASKAEVKSKSMAEIFGDVLTNLQDEDPARKAIQKMLMQTCSERDFSSQEVLHLATGKKLFSASRTFVKINLANNDWVPVGATDSEQPDNDEVNDSNIDEATDEPASLSFVEKYCRRPLSMNGVSLWDAASNFTPKKRGPWSHKRKSAIVSVYPRHRLSLTTDSNEEFYRQQVLLRIPWRKEEDAKGTFLTWESCYTALNVHEQTENMTTIPLLEEEYEEPLPDERDGPEEWMVIAGKGCDDSVEQVELGRREIDLRHNWKASAELYGDIHNLHGFLHQNKTEIPAEIIPNDDEHLTIKLNNEQQQVISLLEKQINAEMLPESDVSAPQLVIVQGKAGCGKSTVIKAMTSRLTAAFGKDSYLLLAPTGSAALNINGNTIHAALSIPVKTTIYQPLTGAASRKFCNEMDNVRFLIIDEYSMIGLPLLGWVERRCVEAKSNNKSLVFGGVKVFLIGDIRQLPPVASKPLYSTKPSTDLEIRGAYAFSLFCKSVILTQSMRQTDETFREALDEVSKGTCSNKNYNLFATRFKKNLDPKEQATFTNAIHIFTIREASKVFNRNKLLSLHCPVARIPGRHNNETARQGSAEDAGGLEPVLYLAEGARTVLRANLWVKNGLVNGSQGTIIDIIYDQNKTSPKHLPTAVMVTFESYIGPTLENGTVPIVPITRTWKKGATVCCREQIPLSLAWASTVHQAQGQTYEKVVVDIGRKEFQAGLSYVALSRCRSLTGMMLNPDFEMSRLDNLQYKKSLKEKLRAEARIARFAGRVQPVPVPIPKHPAPALPIPQVYPKSQSPPLLSQLSINQEEKMEIVNVFEGKLQVFVVPGDGHCLFSSLLHQLDMSTPREPSHRNVIHNLRRKVVEHIQLRLHHPDDNTRVMWRLQIMDSISAQPSKYKQEGGNEEESMRILIEQFLSNLLVDEWGGLETIKAVSEIYKVTIKTYFETDFFENDPNVFKHQIIAPEEDTAQKIIEIVHRLAVGNIHVRNHYDSVMSLL